MKKALLIAALAASLGGCVADSVKNPVSGDTLTAVEDAYGVVLSSAVGYRKLCEKKIIPPSCRPVVLKLQAAAVKAQGAVIAARDFVKNNPEISPLSALLAARNAIADFKAVETKYEVK